MKYFENKLLPLLIKHVIEPAKQGKVPPNWTSNNSESANHILKAAVNWKFQDLLTFVETLHTIVEGEQEERCRAVRNMGNYRLSERYNHHFVEIDHWSNISQEHRDKRTKKFLTDSGKNNQNTIVSSDGTRTVHRTPTAGRKPNQIKRKRAERSRTPNSKRRL